MKKSNRSNSLLMELMLAVLFFMLSAVVLVEIFTGAGTLSNRSDLRNRALPEIQSVADRIWAAEDAEALLDEIGAPTDEGYTVECDGFTLRVTLSSEAAGAGTMQTAYLTALDPTGYELAKVESAKYIPGEAAA